jgi:HEAT repeat protein
MNMKDVGQPFEKLLAQARVAYQDKHEESATYWEIVWLLANRGDRPTLDATLPLARGDVFERSFAAAVLGPFAPRLHFNPLGAIDPPKRFASHEIISVLLEMLEVESDEGVLAALVASLGEHQEQDERIPAALGRFVGHPNSDIRWSIAVGLGSYESTEATEVLNLLSKDRDANVRDWATFGLVRQKGIDSPEAFRTLFARLEDLQAELRAQTIDGLGLRDNPLFTSNTTREFYGSGVPVEESGPRSGLLTALSEMAVDPVYEGDSPHVPLTYAHCEEIFYNRDY